MPDQIPSLKVWISVHDVMPSTLIETQKVLNFLAERGLRKVTILVVPGKNWSENDIDLLRQFQHEGHELAGHGWNHSVEKRKSLFHKLHGIFFSRMVAEHLSLSEQGIAQLITRCYNWFSGNGLQSPELYVPPAWAMGSIRRDRLRNLPFARYEYLTGVYEAQQNQFHRLPLLGYEADTHWRRTALRFSNAINLRRTRHARVCRIAIHPHDLNLLMRTDLERLLTTPE